ncbi:MAG: hypothetical protein ACOH5I_22795 [Oligoflexus sp.]
MQITIFLAFLSLCFSQRLTAQSSEPRRIFLNGVDISSAKHQLLKQVDIKIDGQGHLYIEAPHYDVTEESTYIPLSSLATESASRPRHKTPGPIPKSASTVDPIEPLQGLSKQAKPVRNLYNEEQSGNQQ